MLSSEVEWLAIPYTVNSVYTEQVGIALCVLSDPVYKRLRYNSQETNDAQESVREIPVYAFPV